MYGGREHSCRRRRRRELGGSAHRCQGEGAQRSQEAGTVESRGDDSEKVGAPHYAVLEVRFEGRRLELFWLHEVESAQETAAREGTFLGLRWG